MRLVILLPHEHAILAIRRSIDVSNNEPIMHALDSDVFQYLSSKTDWATGLIGERSAVSYARIALALTEDIPRKAKGSQRQVTRKGVQNSVQRLIKAGLLRSESVSEEEQKCLLLRRVYWLALLKPQNAEKNPDSRQLVGLIHELAKHKLFNNSHLEENNTSADNASYPTGGTYKGISIPNAESDTFHLTLTWQYDQNLVELFLQAAGFTTSQIKQVWFGKYVQHWSQQTIHRTQEEWSMHFANHMQSYLLRPHFFEQVNGMLDYKLPQAKTKTKASRSRRQLTGLTVPNISDGSQLQAWAVAHRLPVSAVGLDTVGYYRFLCRHVEKMSVS